MVLYGNRSTCCQIKTAGRSERMGGKEVDDRKSPSKISRKFPKPEMSEFLKFYTSLGIISLE